MKQLLETIERVLPDGGDWCTLHKASTLAALVVALRPSTIVEIGVWMGGSAIPLALALQHANPSGTLIAIDPWSPEASKEDENPVNQQWWGERDYFKAEQTFRRRVAQLGLDDLVKIWRCRSDDANPPTEIDLIHIDGNHAAPAERDVDRFCPRVRIGGFAVLDDVDWDSGSVARGVDKARAMGFVDVGPLDRGIVMQRRFGGPA